MSKTKKILILLGISFAFALFFNLKSYGYSWPIADSNGKVDYQSTYIEFGYGKRTYTVDNNLWKQEGSYCKTENHYGVDITGKPNTTYKIVSVSDGTVIGTSNNRASSIGISFQNNNIRRGNRSGDGGGYGNYVLIKDNDSDKVFLYAHLAPNTINVSRGTRVKLGQVIGNMGSSGDAGHMHLHFEIRRNISSALASPKSTRSNLRLTTRFDYESNLSETINPVKYIYTYQMANDFVTDLYNNALGREPDAKGKADWIDRIMTGKFTQSQVVQGFINSNEFKNKKYNDSQYIEMLYKACLQRNSDSNGKAHYIKCLNSGISRENILNRVANSSEFNNLCTNYYAKDFATSLYKNILGRNPDYNGLKGWTANITSNRLTPVQVIKGFYNSAEFNKKKYNNSDYVERLYRGCLQRNSDVNGKKTHMNLLNRGVARDQVLKGFLNSTEYRKMITKKYGLSNVGL